MARSSRGWGWKGACWRTCGHRREVWRGDGIGGLLWRRLRQSSWRGQLIFYVLAHGVAQHKIVAKYQAPVVTKSLASPNSNQMHSGYTPAVVTVSAAQGSQKLAHSARSADIVKTIAEPRLEQFPSPRPLSEQEQILANYVTQFHDKAILMARAQTKFREQQEMEFQQFSSNVANEQSSE